MRTFWLRFRERLINFYPPLLGAGIRTRTIDKYTTRVEMKMTALNHKTSLACILADRCMPCVTRGSC